MTSLTLPSNRRLKIVAGMAFLSAFASANAVDYTRVTGVDATGNWTNTAKWSPASFPQTVNDAAILNVGATQRTITLDDSQIIGLFGVGYNTGNTATTGNVRLEGSSTTLTIGSVATPGSIFVGAGTSTTSGAVATTGTLAIGSGVSLDLRGTGGGFYIAGHSANTASAAGATTGVVTMETGASLSLGTSSNRTQWYIGRQTTTGAVAANGTFTASGGSLTAYLSTLVVGQTVRGGVVTNNGSGTLNLANLTSGTIDTHTLLVARSSETSTSGTVTLGNNQSLSVGTASAGLVEIGVRGSSSTERNGVNAANGLVTLGNGSTLSVGTSTLRASMTLGSNAGVAGADIVAQGVINANTGSTFSAYLSSLTLGAQTRDNATAFSTVYRATGNIDLRQATVTAFDVSGDVTIGYHSGAGQGSQGQLRLPETSVHIGGKLTVGDSEIGGGTQASSSGLLDLVGTHVTVGGDATFNLTGRATVAVNGANAGLRLANDSQFTLTLAGANASDSNSAYYITFNDPEEAGLYYGFAWEGNHLTTLQSLVDSFHITWTNNMTSGTVGVYYNVESNLTYIGVVPEPGTTALFIVAAGGLALIPRWRKARR